MTIFLVTVLVTVLGIFNWTLLAKPDWRDWRSWWHPVPSIRELWPDQKPAAAAPIQEAAKPMLKDDHEPFVLSATSGLAFDLNYNFYLFEKDADLTLPIASISKLMAALVFLDHNPGWNETYAIREDDKREGNRLNLFPGEQVYVRDIFYSALVASDNSAIISLMNTTGLGEKDFVAAMNQKAKDLNMTKTNFVEPTGLSDNNVSTARDVARLVAASMQDLDVRRAVLADHYELEILNARGLARRAAKRVIKNTDQLLRNNQLDVKIIGGKTGFLTKAGYCFAGSFQKDDQRIVTVVLGSPDPDARFAETKRLLDWVFDNYDFPN